MELVNLRVVKCNFRNPKVINRYLRKSNIIPDVVLTTLPFWESDLNTILVFEIMGMWPECHFGIVLVSYDFGSNRFRKCEIVVHGGQRCNILQWVVILWHNDCCWCKYFGRRYFTVYRSFAGQWFSVGNCKYLQAMDRFAHKWSKEDSLKLDCPNSGHPKVHSMHIRNLISERFRRFASKTGSIGFKPNAYKVMNFFKGVWERLTHGGTTENHIFPPQAGESQCFQIWKCKYHDYAELRNCFDGENL